MLHKAAPDARASVMGHESRRSIGDGESIKHALALLGESTFRHLKGSPEESRDRAIRILRLNGMPVRQIERISGIGRGIISRVGCDKMP